MVMITRSHKREIRKRLIKNHMSFLMTKVLFHVDGIFFDEEDQIITQTVGMLKTLYYAGAEISVFSSRGKDHARMLIKRLRLLSKVHEIENEEDLKKVYDISFSLKELKLAKVRIKLYDSRNQKKPIPRKIARFRTKTID